MKTFFYFIAVFIFTIIFTLIFHEGGHMLSAYIFDKEVVSVSVMPGYEIYPEFKEIEWKKEIANIKFDPFLKSEEKEQGITMLAGALLTTVIGYLAFLVLVTKKPRGFSGFIIFALSFMTLDFVLYTLLPKIGLRHFIFIGGNEAEPIVGAQMLNVDEIYIIILAIISMFSTLILVYLRFKPEKTIDDYIENKEQVERLMEI